MVDKTDCKVAVPGKTKIITVHFLSDRSKEIIVEVVQRNENARVPDKEQPQRLPATAAKPRRKPGRNVFGCLISALSTMVEEDSESCLSVSGDTGQQRDTMTYRLYDKSNRRFLDSPSPVEIGREFKFPDIVTEEQSASPTIEASEEDPEELMRQHLAGSSDILRSLWEHQLRCEASAAAGSQSYQPLDPKSD